MVMKTMEDEKERWWLKKMGKETGGRRSSKLWIDGYIFHSTVNYISP